uniref:Ring finger protein 220a n=1 Tax=Gasterosteus aculeatus aculeatus TaxID=481459 RepID=A0AAQ4R7P7_GASAC
MEDEENNRETFLRVRANRQTRLNARIGKMKRRKPEDGGQVCPLCSAPLAGSEEEMSRHVEQCLIQREGALGDDDSADMDGENGRGFEEYEWAGQKRIRATALLEGGFRGTGFATCSIKESAADSDVDLDVDGDDTLEYGKAQYTEADIIPCSGAGEDQGEAREREALRGAVLNGGMPSNRITPEFSKWASDEMPSTSNGESSKTDPSTPSSSSSTSSSSCAPRTCKNSEIEKVTEDESTATTMEALKARIRELERQILRGDRYKCLICMREPAIQSGAEIKSLGVWPGPRPLAHEVRERQPKSLPLGLYCLYRGLVIGGYGSGIKRLLLTASTEGKELSPLLLLPPPPSLISSVLFERKRRRRGRPSDWVHSWIAPSSSPPCACLTPSLLDACPIPCPSVRPCVSSDLQVTGSVAPTRPTHPTPPHMLPCSVVLWLLAVSFRWTPTRCRSPPSSAGTSTAKNAGSGLWGTRSCALSATPSLHPGT